MPSMNWIVMDYASVKSYYGRYTIWLVNGTWEVSYNEMSLYVGMITNGVFMWTTNYLYCTSVQQGSVFTNYTQNL